jgi:transposase
VAIGRLDPATGEPVYKQEYIDRMAAAGTPVQSSAKNDKDIGTISVNSEAGDFHRKKIQNVLDRVKDFGVFYFLQSIAEKINLLDILAQTIPECWQEVFVLACYLIASDKPVMYCNEWVSSNESFDVGSMSSQRISELLEAFGNSERHAFYQEWYRHIREQEYIALDITSVSSYSKQMAECEWGYNRDHENIPQVNICMLFGEESKLPVFQTIYSGSLKDVSTLESTLSEFTAVVGEKDIMVVMDKGFFSASNVNALIGENDPKGFKFLISVPFTSKFARNQVESERKDIDRIANVIQTSGSPIRGIHKLRAWGSKEVKLHAHVYYNPEKATKDRNDLFGLVAWLKKLAQKDPDNKKHRNEMKHYLCIRRSEGVNAGVTVSVREDIVAKELATTGWFVLISNQIDDAQRAYDVYRIKDVVEKGFMKYKNNLGLDRLRVHSDKRMQNKTFVAFIALILASRIHNVMKRTRLYEQMTFDRLLITLAKLKTVTVDSTRILRPITKEQKKIFKAFKIALPQTTIDMKQLT